jgi:hypothetical protein
LAPNLCVPVLLGGSFLALNSIVIDHEFRTCIDKKSGYDLLHPPPIKRTVIKPKPTFDPKLKKLQQSVVADVASLFPHTWDFLDNSAEANSPSPVTAIHTHMECLVTDEVLRLKDKQFKDRFQELFPPDVPDVRSAGRCPDEHQTTG